MNHPYQGGSPGVWASCEVPKRYFDGTHRTVSPAETIARVKPYFTTFGITRVANVTGLDRLAVPVVTVCRPNARSLAVFQGKGLTLEAAKASGIMEAIEVWHAERIIRPLKFASLEEMRGEHRMVDVAALPRTGAVPFDPKAPVFWIEAADLLGAGAVWVPNELVSTNYTLPLPPGSGYFPASSNGLASGNHSTEAILHALCEVIERDARTLWELASPSAQADRMLDLATIDDVGCQTLIAKLQACGLQVHVWDITSDVGVASFVCQLLDGTDETADPEVGSGCHPARPVALLRALTEAVQARTTYITGSRDDYLAQWYDPDARRQRRTAMLRRTHLAQARRSFQLVPNFQSMSLSADVRWMLARLRSVGIAEALVVDLSRDAIGIPVVRVVVPGLEGPMSFGDMAYVPGRRARKAGALPL